MKENFFWIIGSLFVIYGCIPIEDKINPNVSEFALNDTYYYQDTITFDVIYTDNALLDSGFITISKVLGEPTSASDWDTTISYALVGRRLEQQYKIVVPDYKAPGRYQISVNGIDADGNQVVTLQQFNLLQDRYFPEVHDLKLGLTLLDNGNYLACRNEIIEITGGVSDNLSVNRLGFSLSSGQGDTEAVSGDSLDVAATFGDNVIVPSNAIDQSFLTLTLFAIDTFSNRVSQDFTIQVECDDEPPAISVANTRPQLDVNNNVNVVQGTSFTIGELLISDNRFIVDAQVYYNLQNRALQPLYNIAINSLIPVNIADSVDMTFTVSEEDPVGQVNEITVVATDSVGNVSEPLIINLTVIEDDPPSILITNTYIDGVEKEISDGGINLIKRGESFTFDGKVEELNQLSLFEIYWGIESNLEVIVQEKEFNSLPLNLSDLINSNSFVIPSEAETGELFILKLLAIDSKDQSAEVEYQFRITD